MMKTHGFLGWLLLISVVLVPGPTEAKPFPSVTASFETASTAVQVGAAVDLVLRLTATADASDVTAELLPSSAVQIVSGPVQWSGSVRAGDTVAIPFQARFLGGGDYTLGARVMNPVGGRTQISGAVLYVTTTGATAELSTTDHFTRRLASAVTAPDRIALGVATPALPRPPADEPPVGDVSGTVRGTVRWIDPEGAPHPVRGALVQILDGGPTGSLLANTVTGGNGQYSAPVSATTNQVTVSVFTVEGSGGDPIVRVHPDGQPDIFYRLLAGPVALIPSLTVDLTATRTQRGSPGSPDPTPNTITSRAFSVFDAMRTYWYQSSALLGRNMPAARVNFPSTACGAASCAASGLLNGVFFVIRDDAYDWDVLGGEFARVLAREFSFGTPASGRVITNSPGGSYTGGTAIGENGRNRDEGMRLAWSVGLATTLALLLQQTPLATVSPFPANLLNIADGKFDDTEDANFAIEAETPSLNDGFGSPNSVLGVLWDLFDTPQDAAGAVTDGIAGLSAKTLWDALTKFLACNPCDRLDRVWDAIVSLLVRPSGPTFQVDPVIFEVARAFVINKVAPRATAPADGSTLDDTPPTFKWVANGDPSVTHRNNQFLLVLSPDSFQTLFPIDIPASPTPSPEYTLPRSKWNQLRRGRAPTDVYKWLVLGASGAAGPGNPRIPEGTYWFSNPMTFSAEPVVACSTAQVAGGDTPDTRTVELDQSPATFKFDYETFTVKDRMVVRHDGATLFDTDCVATNGTQTVTLNLSGGSTSISVQVIPNCAGGTSGTAWNYTAHCPSP